MKGGRVMGEEKKREKKKEKDDEGTRRWQINRCQSVKYKVKVERK
jgi:hypothetical protein